MLEEKEDCVILSLYIQPKSQKNEIVGEYNDMLKLKVNALPEDGKANKEIVKFLSKKIKTAKQNIEIVSGESSRIKKIKIFNLKKEEIIKKLGIDN